MILSPSLNHCRLSTAPSPPPLRYIMRFILVLDHLYYVEDGRRRQNKSLFVCVGGGGSRRKDSFLPAGQSHPVRDDTDYRVCLTEPPPDAPPLTPPTESPQTQMDDQTFLCFVTFCPGVSACICCADTCCDVVIVCVCARVCAHVCV